MIIINTRCTNNKTTGVQKYTLSILKHLRHDLKEIRPAKKFSFGIKGHLWEQFLLPGRIRKNDLLWSPANTGPAYMKNQVITIHDLAWLEHPEWYNSRFVKMYKWLTPKLVNNVKHIFTVSEFTKSKLTEKFGVSDGKITVVYCGIDKVCSISEDEKKQCLKKYSLDKPYILYVGSIEPRKNLKKLLEAWKFLPKGLKNNLDLVIIGAKGNVFAKFDIPKDDVIMPGYVSSSELNILLQEAKLFIFPSLYEGFGLPPLEAMAAGVPTCVSDIPVFREVYGNATEYFDPYNIESIASTIKSLLGDDDRKKELVELGKEKAKLFTWQKSAEKHIEIISRISGLIPEG